MAYKRRRTGKGVRKGYTRSKGNYGRYKVSSKGAQELKYKDNIDVDSSSMQGTAGAHKLDLLQVVEGAGAQERIGRKVTIKKILVTVRMTLSRATTVGFNSGHDSSVYRFMMVQDKQTNGLDIDLSDVVSGSGITAHINLENGHRFRVLADKLFTITPANAYAIDQDPSVSTLMASSKRMIFKCNKNVNIPVFFSGSTGGTVELRSNSVWCFIWSDEGALTSTLMNSRIRYTDS